MAIISLGFLEGTALHKNYNWAPEVEYYCPSANTYVEDDNNRSASGNQGENMYTKDYALEQESDTYLRFIWLWVFFSSIVFFEPSPYDVLFIICFISALLFSKLSFTSTSIMIFVMVGIFVNANLVSLFFAGNIVKSTSFFFKTMYLIGTWVFIIGLLNRYRQGILGVIFSGYLVSAIFSVSLGVAAYFQLIPHAELLLWYGRITGLFKDPNVFGPFVIPAIVYSIFLFESNRGFKRIVLLGVIAFLSIGVVLCFSRAAWGNYLISVAVYFFIPARVSLKQRICTLIILSILVLPTLFILINHPQVNYLFNQRTKLQGYDDNRFGAQLAALKLAVDNPVGVGPGQSETLLSYAPHNLYVRIITENGVLGIAAFVNLFLCAIIHSLKSFKKNPYSPIVSAVLIGIFFNSFFIDTIHWRHFWLFLALPWISENPVRENPIPENQIPEKI